jgi:hypothetical protein
MNNKGYMNSSEHLVFRDNEKKIYQEIAEKHLLTEDYFKEYPDEKERFQLDFWDFEWKSDFFIHLDNIHECCEIVK